MSRVDIESLKYCVNFMTLHLQKQKQICPTTQDSPLLAGNATAAFIQHEEYVNDILLNKGFKMNTMLSQNFLQREKKRILCSSTPNITFCVAWLEYLQSALQELLLIVPLTSPNPRTVHTISSEYSYTELDALLIHIDEMMERNKPPANTPFWGPLGQGVFVVTGKKDKWPNLFDLASMIKFMLKMLMTTEKDPDIAQQRGEEAYTLIFAFMDHAWGFAPVNTRIEDLKFRSLKEVERFMRDVTCM